mgnify:CR=1 FL=1
METVKSARYQLIKHEAWKIFKGFCYAALGSGLAWLLQYFQAVDFGNYQVFASAVISVLALTIHKFFSTTEYLKK